MTNVAPPRSDPSGTSWLFQKAGAAQPHPSGSRNDMLLLFGSTNFVHQPAITTNIAPPPAMMTNVAPPRSGPSGASRVVQTAGAVPPPLSTEQPAGHPPAMMTNVAPQQSGPSGTLQIVQSAGAAPPPPSGTRKDALPSFGLMNFVH